MKFYYIEAPHSGAQLSKLAEKVAKLMREYDGYLASEEELADLVEAIRQHAEKCNAMYRRCTPVWVRASEGFKGMQFISIGTKEETAYSLIAKQVKSAVGWLAELIDLTED